MKIVGAIPDHILRQMPQAERDQLGARGITFEQAQIKLAEREEKELQRQVFALLRLHGIESDASAMHKKTTRRIGWPDATFGAHGVACAFEMKRPGEKLSPEQESLREKLIAPPNCWRYFVIHSVAEAVEALRELKVLK